MKLPLSKIYVDTRGQIQFGVKGQDERVVKSAFEYFEREYGLSFDLDSAIALPTQYVEICTALPENEAEQLAKKLGYVVQPWLTLPNRKTHYAQTWRWEIEGFAEPIDVEHVVYQLALHLNRTQGFAKVELRPLRRTPDGGGSLKIEKQKVQNGYNDWYIIGSCFADWILKATDDLRPAPIPPQWKTALFIPFAKAPVLNGVHVGHRDSERWPDAETPVDLGGCVPDYQATPIR